MTVDLTKNEINLLYVVLASTLDTYVEKRAIESDPDRADMLVTSIGDLQTLIQKMAAILNKP